MRYRRVRIEGLAHCLPEVVIKTSVLEKTLQSTYDRLGLPLGTLEMMTGVAERRIWREQVTVADAAILAGEKLLQNTGFDRSKLSALISCSVSRDHLEPSIAALVHGALKLPDHCRNFDVGNACLGFLTAIELAAGLIEAQQMTSVLIVAGESSRAVTQATTRKLSAEGVTFADYRDNLASLTLGSASVALLLADERISQSPHRLFGATACADTAHAGLCLGSNEGMTTDAPTLLSCGVALAQKTWQKAQAELQIAPDQVAEFAFHQVGKANHDAVLKALQLPESKAVRLYPRIGNVGAAGVPLTLSWLNEQQRLQEGNLVVLMGIGSGLNVAVQGILW